MVNTEIYFALLLFFDFDNSIKKAPTSGRKIIVDNIGKSIILKIKKVIKADKPINITKA